MMGTSRIQNNSVINMATAPVTTVDPHFGFKHIPNAAQYKGSDYATAIDVRRGISLEEALDHAAANDEIDYFFIVKGLMMVLELPEGMSMPKDPLNLITNQNFIFDSDELGQGNIRLFHNGDAVFFKKGGEWFGSAPELADIYQKQE